MTEQPEQQNIQPVQNTVEQEATAQPVAKKGSVVDKILTGLLILLILVLVVVFVVKFYVTCQVTVSGASMMPNYVDKQVVRVNKRAMPERGDVVIFYLNEVDNKLAAEFARGSDIQVGGKYEKLIKRVVALEGDKLWLEPKDGDVVLVIQTPDGQILHENYIIDGQPAKFFNPDKTIGTTAYVGVKVAGKLSGTTKENPFVVEEGKFFAMGDNRLNSNDCRAFGAIPYSHIYGVVKQK